MSQNKAGEMTKQIFAATERLMAKHGLHYLSMHKIAKEADISAGTIYVYFKNKEELLELLARTLFEDFQAELAKEWNPDAEPFQQYRRIWLNLWRALLSNPTTTLNMSQYQSLPNFFEMCQEYKNSDRDQWHIFCHQAIERGALVNLPSEVLFALSMESAMNLAFEAVQRGKDQFPATLLETIIERSWRAIQK